MRQSSPIAVRPRICAKGPTMESSPMRHARIDGDGFRLLNGDARQHQLLHFSLAKDFVHFGQFHAGVDAQQFGRIRHFHGGDRVAGAAQDLNDVGQVIFVRGIVGTDFDQMLPQQIGTETIDAGVDEWDGELRGRGCLVFNNRSHIALFAENDAAVAGRVRQARGDQGGCGIARRLAADQLLQSGGGKQRAVAIEHHDESGLGSERVAAGEQGMSSALLLGLIDKMDAGRRQKRPYLISLMPHHDGGVARRRDDASRLDYMLDQRHPAGAMQHFRALGFHAGAKPGGQDHHIGLRMSSTRLG